MDADEGHFCVDHVCDNIQLNTLRHLQSHLLFCGDDYNNDNGGDDDDDDDHGSDGGLSPYAGRSDTSLYAGGGSLP